MSMFNPTNEWPSSFLDLKRELVQGTTQERITASWNDLLAELTKHTDEIARKGQDFIPQVNFADLDKLTPEEIDAIKRKGCVVFRGVVDIEVASDWKTELDEFLKNNPDAPGYPAEDKRLLFLYWTRPQVQLRAHPNVLKTSAWLNNLWHFKSGKIPDGVDLCVPLSYADRFRIRKPDYIKGILPPHIDGASIDRWKDENFRRCFQNILDGNWRQHDPYELGERLEGISALQGKMATSIMRTFQGWLPITEIAPTQSTIQIFPDVLLSNAYIILRPFFRPTVPEDSPDILDPKNWKFDISTPDFPGLILFPGGHYYGPCPTPVAHPHLRLEQTMISAPKVNPGDMVFWHCDAVHAVEDQHTGTNDSAVLYIAAVPKTPLNSDYIAKQAETFLTGGVPSDYVIHGVSKTPLVGLATDADIKEPMARLAMGLPIQVA